MHTHTHLHTSIQRMTRLKYLKTEYVNLYKYFNKISASNDLSFWALIEIFLSLSSFVLPRSLSTKNRSAIAAGFRLFYFGDVSLSFCSITFFTLMKIRIDRYNLLSRCAFVYALYLIGFSLSSLRKFNDLTQYVTICMHLSPHLLL